MAAVRRNEIHALEFPEIASLSVDGLLYEYCYKILPNCKMMEDCMNVDVIFKLFFKFYIFIYKKFVKKFIRYREKIVFFFFF